MTREEEKAKESKKHYCDDINCYYAFLHGAEWADKHPNLESLWRDASEEPHNGSHILMQYNYEGDKELKSFHIKYDEYMNWQKLIKIYGISQWAYISDLLPKGGEQ